MACNEKPRPAIEYQYIGDLPEAGLVQPCDTAERAYKTNGELLGELHRTRRQRDDCAAQITALSTWRKQASDRMTKANAANKPE